MNCWCFFFPIAEGHASKESNTDRIDAEEGPSQNRIDTTLIYLYIYIYIFYSCLFLSEYLYVQCINKLSHQQQQLSIVLIGVGWYNLSLMGLRSNLLRSDQLIRTGLWWSPAYLRINERVPLGLDLLLLLVVACKQSRPLRSRLSHLCLGHLFFFQVMCVLNKWKCVVSNVWDEDEEFIQSARTVFKWWLYKMQF